jgi:hypothetical protein
MSNGGFGGSHPRDFSNFDALLSELEAELEKEEAHRGTHNTTTTLESTAVEPPTDADAGEPENPRTPENRPSKTSETPEQLENPRTPETQASKTSKTPENTVEAEVVLRNWLAEEGLFGLALDAPMPEEGSIIELFDDGSVRLYARNEVGVGSIVLALDKREGYIGLDLETTALEPQDGEIRLVQVSRGNFTGVVDCFYTDPTEFLQYVAGRKPVEVEALKIERSE